MTKEISPGDPSQQDPLEVFRSHVNSLDSKETPRQRMRSIVSKLKREDLPERIGKDPRTTWSGYTLTRRDLGMIVVASSMVIFGGGYLLGSSGENDLAESYDGPTKDETPIPAYGIFYGDAHIQFGRPELSVISSIPFETRQYDILQINGVDVEPYKELVISNPLVTNQVPTRYASDFLILTSAFRTQEGTTISVPIYVELDSILNDPQNPSSAQDRIIRPFDIEGQARDVYETPIPQQKIGAVSQES